VVLRWVLTESESRSIEVCDVGEFKSRRGLSESLVQVGRRDEKGRFTTHLAEESVDLRVMLVNVARS
jgi:hypothetical protein